MLTIEDLSPDELDYWHERAAIYQYDGMYFRHEAEQMALISVEARRDREEYEKEVKE